jgi:hypothetical protein
MSIEKHDQIDTKDDIEHVEAGGLGVSASSAKKEAIHAEQADVNMGILEAIRTHKTAVFWSLMMSMTVVSIILSDGVSLVS